MTFSYTGAGSGPIDAVRFAVGDTDARAPLLQDEDIAYLLEQTRGNVRAAALLACEGIIASLSRLCDQSVGSVSKSFSQQRDGFERTRALLAARSAYAGGRPFAGGISRFVDQTAREDRDRVRPQFTTRMMKGREARGNRDVVGLPLETADDGD